jgi:hypothetical protein
MNRNGRLPDLREAFVGLKATRVIEPDRALAGAYQAAYETWHDVLKAQLPVA